MKEDGRCIKFWKGSERFKMQDSIDKCTEAQATLITVDSLAVKEVLDKLPIDHQYFIGASKVNAQFYIICICILVFREMMGSGAGWMEHLWILPSGHLVSLILALIVLLVSLAVGAQSSVKTWIRILMKLFVKKIRTVKIL